MAACSGGYRRRVRPLLAAPGCAQHPEQAPLLGQEPAAVAGGLLVPQVRQRALDVEVHDVGVHVRRTGDGRRVAELAGDHLDRGGGLAPPAASDSRRVERRQRGRREQRADPGAEVLRGEVVAGRLAQVVVDVAGLDLVLRAVVVDVLEQPLAREVAALADDAGGPGVVDGDLVPLPALAREA